MSNTQVFGQTRTAMRAALTLLAAVAGTLGVVATPLAGVANAEGSKPGIIAGTNAVAADFDADGGTPGPNLGQFDDPGSKPGGTGEGIASARSKPAGAGDGVQVAGAKAGVAVGSN